MQVEPRKIDKLYTLCTLCDVVDLDANYHRNIYETVEKYLTKLRDGGLEITEEVFQRMIAGDTLFTLDFYPENADGGLSLVGDDLDAMLTQAIDLARPWALDEEELAATDDEKYASIAEEHNATCNFLRVVELSKCGVGFSKNEHRTCEISDGPGLPMRQQTAKDALEILSWSDDDLEKDIEEGKCDIMIDEDILIQAYAYHRTPVGSYNTMHYNVWPCLRELRLTVENASVEVTYSGGLNVDMDKVAEFLGKEEG